MLVPLSATNATSALQMVTPMTVETRESIFSVRLAGPTENYFSFVAANFALLLGERFCRQVSNMAGSLYAIQFAAKNGELDLKVTVCAFCPEQRRRPSAEEVLVLQTMQVNPSSLDRLRENIDNYRRRDRTGDNGGNLGRQISGVIFVLREYNFAISSLTSFRGIRTEGEVSTSHQLDYYLPQQTGGLMVTLSWRETRALLN